jgi:hypothetical protein
MSSNLFAQNSFELLISTPDHDALSHCMEDYSGNFYFVGSRRNTTSNERCGYIVKVDNQGDIVKESLFCAPDSINTFSNILYYNDTLIVFGLKGVVDSGYTVFWKMKLDLDLNILLDRKDHILNGYRISSFNSINNHAGNYIICGSAVPESTPQYRDIFFYEINQSFDSITCSVEVLSGLQRCLDFFEVPDKHNYKAFGIHNPTPFASNDHIINYDSNFNHINTDSIPWGVKFQVSANIIDDSTYLIGGYKYFDLNNDFGIVKLNMEDEFLGAASYGKQGDTVEHVAYKSISHVTKDNIYFGGCTNFITQQWPWQEDNNWIYLVNLDSNLNDNWQRFYGGDAFYNPFGVYATQDGGCIVFGSRYDENINFDEYDVYILKVDSNGLLTGTTDLPTLSQDEILFAPNPASGPVTIKFPGVSHLPQKRLVIFNSIGAQVFETTLQQGSDRQQLDLSFLPSGIYFATIHSISRRVASGKLLIAR